MPLSGGTSGAHDDSMHQGSAKRNIVSGVAALDVSGDILAVGNSIHLVRDGANKIRIEELTSNETWLLGERIGVSSFKTYTYVGGIVKEIVNVAMKDVVNGIASLDAAGALLLPGSKMYFTRDGSDDVHIYERTSDEEAYAFHRVGADDYTFFVKESNVWKRMQTESMKDIANGIAGLDANGHVLAPGYRFTAARGAAEQITIRERTSDERAFRWIRIGANDYEARVNVGGVEKVVQHEGMKDVASGIAGLDASVKLLWNQLPLPMLTVAQFQANAATGTINDPDQINDNNTGNIANADAIGEYGEILFDHPMFIREFRQYGDTGNSGDGTWKLQIKQDGVWVDNTIGIASRTTRDWSDWQLLTSLVYTQGLRLVATAIDTGFSATFISELEVRG